MLGWVFNFISLKSTIQNFIGCHRGSSCVKHWTIPPCSSICDLWFHNLVLVKLYHFLPKLLLSLISSQLHLFSYAVIHSLSSLLASCITYCIFSDVEKDNWQIQIWVYHGSVSWITDKRMFCFVHKSFLNNFQLRGFLITSEHWAAIFRDSLKYFHNLISD